MRRLNEDVVETLEIVEFRPVGAASPLEIHGS